MKNEKFRKALVGFVEEHGFEDGIKILEDHTFDNSVVGITEDGRAVYDYGKMVEEYMNDEKCGEIEAVEWLDYNTLRAIPYMGEGAPIVIMNSKDTILELYGD